jgi:hypothetical protein
VGGGPITIADTVLLLLQLKHVRLSLRTVGWLRTGRKQVGRERGAQSELLARRQRSASGQMALGASVRPAVAVVDRRPRLEATRTPIPMTMVRLHTLSLTPTGCHAKLVQPACRAAGMVPFAHHLQNCTAYPLPASPFGTSPADGGRSVVCQVLTLDRQRSQLP